MDVIKEHIKLKCICGDTFEIDYDFRNRRHVAECLLCGKIITNRSYYKLIDDLEIIDVESILLLHKLVLEQEKRREIEFSYIELTHQYEHPDQYINDELSADFLESSWS